MELTSSHLATIIRFHRKKSGLTQSNLAKLSNVGKTAVFDIEHGKISVQLDTLLKIMSTLNIKLLADSPLMPLLERNR